MSARRPSIQRRPGGPRRRPRNGYTLMELLITLLVLMEVMVAILLLFDTTNQLARSQMQTTELQDSQRVAQTQLLRIARLAGRGGLPGDAIAADFDGDGDDDLVGRALVVVNDVPSGTQMDPSDPTTEILAGTDVFIVRGLMDYPTYIINSEDPAHFVVDRSDPGNVTGQLRIFEDPLPATPLGNDVDDLRKLRDEGVKAPLIVVSDRSESIFAVVEFDPSTSALDAAAGSPAVVNFKVNNGDHSTDYLALSAGGTFQPTLNSVAFAGIVQEYRFYVRMAREIPGDNTSRLTPRLALARFMAGTNQIIDTQDVADNVIDLQVAAAVDLNRDGVILDLGDPTDEWLFNDDRDDVTTVDGDNSTLLATSPVRYLRISTIAVTDRPNIGYVAPLLTQLEDHAYDATSPWNQAPEDRYRRAIQTDFVDMRNVQ